MYWVQIKCLEIRSDLHRIGWHLHWQIYIQVDVLGHLGLLHKHSVAE